MQWPLGVGGKGNEGVAAFVKQTKNSIGYVEYAYVLQNKMAYGLIQNKAGKFVKPDLESFQAAAESAEWPSSKDFALIMTDAPGDKAYPVTATVFIIMYKTPKAPERAKLAMDFFAWATHHGQKQAEALDYVPLPSALVQQVDAYWNSHSTTPAIKASKRAASRALAHRLYIWNYRYMNNESAILALSALAQSTRLYAFAALVRAGPKGLSAGHIARKLGVPQNTLSAHLAVLARSGLVRSERQSRQIFYASQLDQIRQLTGFLINECCNGHPELCAPQTMRRKAIVHG